MLGPGEVEVVRDPGRQDRRRVAGEHVRVADQSAVADERDVVRWRRAGEHPAPQPRQRPDVQPGVLDGPLAFLQKSRCCGSMKSASAGTMLKKYGSK